MIIFRVFFLLLLANCAAGCAPPRPEMPEGYSLPFTCTYSGFIVVEGWLTVDDRLSDYADRLDLSQGLDCDSEEYKQLKCYID